MPIYVYHHDQCGMDQEFHLDKDVESVVVDCYRCGYKVTARQRREHGVFKGEADGLQGYLREEKQNGQNRNSQFRG